MAINKDNNIFKKGKLQKIMQIIVKISILIYSNKG